MKILLLQDYLRSGGTERQTLFLARAFRRAGHEAAVLTFRPGGTLAPGYEDVLLPPLQSFDLGLDWFAPGLVTRVHSYRPEVLMTMGRMANSYGRSLQRRLPSVPVVATVRTGKPLPYFYRRSLHAARAVVANSHETAARLVNEEKVPAERVHTIHNSLVFNVPPHSGRTTGGAALRAQTGADLDTRVLLCVGMFRREKNQIALLRAADLLPKDARWQLWLVGEGEERAACARYATTLGLSDRVRFFGFQADPTPFYQAADLAVLASSRESLSNFLIEAQAQGLPVIAFDAQGVRECLLAGETGTVVPFGDTHSLAQAWEALMRDEKRRQAWGVRAREHARHAFAPERQAEAYLQLYAKLIARV